MKPIFTYCFILLIVTLSGLNGCTVAPVKQAEVKEPREIAFGSDAKPIAFQKMVVKIPLGDEIAKIQYGWWCAPGSTIGWRGGKLNVTDEEFEETFKKELESKHFPVVGDPYALFGDSTGSKAELVVAGLIDKVEINVCFPFSGSPTADIGNTSMLKGGTFMHITWQVYSRVDNKVVYQTTTEGTFESAESISGGAPIFLRNAFAANVKNLLADSGFYNLVRTSSHAPKIIDGI